MGLFNLEHRMVWYAYFGDFREWGTDCDGRLMKLADYAKDTPYRWEIDHAFPSALGGSNHLANKRPRHSYGNALAGAMLGNALNPRRGLF